MRDSLKIPEHDHLKYLSKIRVLENGCWTTGSKGSFKNYRTFYIKGKSYLSHRVSYEIFNGALVGGLVIDHKCVNRYCVNPEHLRQVTQKVNLAENTRSEKVNRIRDLNQCKNGHSLNGDNVIFFTRKNGPQKGYTGRLCRVCDNKKNREKYQRKIRCESNKPKSPKESVERLQTF
jgi:hypothetical protein